MLAPTFVLTLAALGPVAGGDETPHFAEPVQLTAGDAVAGIGRMYASPGFHDVDGDGHLDLVVGDLPGRVTWAKRLPGEAVAFAAEEPMKRSDGERLEFNNW